MQSEDVVGWGHTLPGSQVRHWPGEALSVLSPGPLWSPSGRWRWARVVRTSGPDPASITVASFLFVSYIGLSQKSLLRESILQIALKTRCFFKKSN